jgi:hypothetical protein
MECWFDVSLISLADQDKYHARNRAGERQAHVHVRDTPIRQHAVTPTRCRSRWIYLALPARRLALDHR